MGNFCDEKRGCGQSKWWLRPPSDPLHDICVQHDEAYDSAQSYKDVLKADLRFTRRSVYRAGLTLLEAVIYPPIILFWGLFTKPWKRREQDERNSSESDSRSEGNG